MSNQLQSFFSRQAQHLREGRITALAQSYQTPLPVYLVGDARWHKLSTRRDVVSVFEAKHAGVAAAGIGRMRACVIGSASAAPTNPKSVAAIPRRVRADVIWFFVGSDGSPQDRTTASYFMQRVGGRLRVVMIEFYQIGFPQMDDWFADHAGKMPDRPATFTVR